MADLLLKSYGTLNASGGDAEQGDKSPRKLAESPAQPLGFVALCMIVYFNVSGGPFLSEKVVGAAGPLVAILTFLIFPIFYCVPAALITAELSTTFPEDAGVAAWVTAAYGPRAGFTQGLLFWIQGSVALASYPGMFVAYAQEAICPKAFDRPDASMAMPTYHPCDDMSHHMAGFLPANGTLLIIVFILGITYLNWCGLKFVGSMTIVLVVFLLLPFVVLCLVGLPDLQPHRWLNGPQGYGPYTEVNWFMLLNNTFWLYNYWDSTSTLAGEVAQPEKSIPRALFWCMLVAVLGYTLPVMVCSAALPVQTWGAGAWVQFGYELGGHFLQWWILLVALVSFIGQFLAGQATASYELAGMAEIGQLPSFFAVRNVEGVPILPLIMSTTIAFLVVASGSMEWAITLTNCIYCIAEVISYATFLELRWRHPTLDRPFRIELSTAGCALILLIPFAVSVYLISHPFYTGQWGLVAILVTVTCLGPVLYSAILFHRSSAPGLYYTERCAHAAVSARDVKDKSFSET